MDRRRFLKVSGYGSIAAASGAITGCSSSASTDSAKTIRAGSQRLSLNQLQQWEDWKYGMFIHFGMSTYEEKEFPDGNSPLSLYQPDKLDVDQWVSVARDAGMRYAVLVAKHVAGLCLWPSDYTDYTVANSPVKTDVFEKFVRACEDKGLEAGFHYCSWDNHHKFGSMPPLEGRWDMEEMGTFPKGGLSDTDKLPCYTSSVYQNFQTAQVTELLTQYGPIGETWIDIPGVLGWGYRTFLYHHIAELQPETVIMMNTGISDGSVFPVSYAWPSDLIAIERNLPPETGHKKWRNIEGKRYYLPGEVCDPIGKEWFFIAGDNPRPDQELAEQYLTCRQRGTNFLLNVPPDKSGRIPEMHIKALMRLKKNVNL